MMEVVVRQGWTLSLVFGVGQSDEYAIEKTKFVHEYVHAYGLCRMVGLSTQPFRDVGVKSAQRHGIELNYGHSRKITRVQHFGEILK
jgi:hypothetical protein